VPPVALGEQFDSTVEVRIIRRDEQQVTGAAPGRWNSAVRREWPFADKESSVSSTRSGLGKAVLATGLTGIWIGLCEFVRNQFLLTSQWQDHYRAMGLEFPSKPLNGMVWMVWSFLAAGVVFAVSRRFGLWATTLIAWVTGYVMMWVVIWNLSVLPLEILPVAVPLSFVEALGATFICRKLARPERT